ncbi:integrase core domain-containing protein, partial [Mariniluteicoccus endophyticus]
SSAPYWTPEDSEPNYTVICEEPSFNSRIRDECLNINSFYSLLHAQVVIGDWKDEYNHHRRHSSLGYLRPAEYARQCTHQIETDDSHTVRTE